MSKRFASKINLKQVLPYVVPVAVAGGVILVGYKVYQKFFGNTPTDDAVNNAQQTAATDYTTRAATTATSLKQLQDALSAQGLNVSNMHQGYANTLNADMDSSWVDHNAIVGLVSSMGIETFQLTAIAYGQRELRNYRDSLTHILEPSFWTDMFAPTKLYGGLKFHLQTVLSSDELSSISMYINSVP